MKKISISGQIIPEHWWGENEVTEDDVKKQLADVQPGEDVEISINSPGGDVFTAIAIFNHIREFSKAHACTVVMQGIVGSAASYIALAAKAGNPASVIKAYDNSIFFIHNAQAEASGDWHEMERVASLAKSISDLICNSAYAKVSSDSVEEIHAAMDAETYYFGEEIRAHGYADVIEGAADTDGATEGLDRGAMVAHAKAQYENCMRMLRQWMDKSDENRQIAARLSASFSASLGGSTVNKPRQEDSRMDITELKAKYPDVYNAVYAAGVAEERSRVSAHLKMAADSGDVSAAVDFIKAGTAVAANEVTAKYHEVFCRTQLKNARIEDNTPPVVTPSIDKTDAQSEALSAYKKLMMGGR